MVRLADSEIAVTGYSLIEQLYASPKTLVYRALRNADQKPVILKLLRHDAPTYKELVQFRNQYTILSKLTDPNIFPPLPGIIQPYGLEPWDDRYVLVMEDWGGIALSQFTQKQAIAIPEFLPIAIQLAAILHDLYQQRVIHKDIKPDNILIHPRSKQVKLIDFAISSLLPRETQENQNPNGLEGTLAYLAPEQTGRMNRGIDYRSDFYALGITFYELLTGILPFQADDPMELVHAHLAKVPLPVHTINPNIPMVLSHVVAKLMAKNAEDRYQSALGLKHDLEICWHSWQETGTIAEFAIAQQDRSDRFMLPEKLYGRSDEVQALLDAFERSSLGKAELTLVTGFSGIGKTAIVNEVHKPIARRRGYFIQGKYDQFQRNIPFSAIVQAFQNLVRQLLKESNAQIEQWQTKILNAVGENGQVIIDLIPDIELLIGAQPAIPELDATASQNRLNWVFQQFIQVFPSADHPLVIFLDDLQWADSASLNLLQTLLGETELHHLLLIGAYRDNEVNSVHPLMLALNHIQKQGITVNPIALAPFCLADLNQLVADTLHQAPEDVSSLTQLVFTKTQGNPFFSTQFLKSLYDSDLITFNTETGIWQWDCDQIQSLSLTDDVVEFMATQLQKLPESTQTLLKLAACIGSPFDLKTLAIVSGTTQVGAAAGLWEALHAGLILSPMPHALSPDSLYSELVDLQSVVTTYTFLHDRVQQAAYQLIPDVQRVLTHLQIGQLLLNKTAPEEREIKVFEIANQLNQGREFIYQPSEQLELAQLNLMAARKAIATTAYRTAMEYATIGIELLPIDRWQSQYELSLRLYEVATEAAFLTGQFEQMEQWAETVLQQVENSIDCLKVNEVRIQACTSQNKLFEAIAIARSALNSFGIHFPEPPSPEDLQQAFQETAVWIAGKTNDELLDLPLMGNPEALAIMQLAANMIPPVYLAEPELYPLIILLLVRLSVQHGNAAVSAFGYAMYSVLLNTGFQDIDTADQFGKLAFALANRFNSKANDTKAYFVLGAFIVHWKAHIRETLPLLLKSYQTGLEIGNPEFVGYATKDICQYSYFLGYELPALEIQIQAYSQGLATLKQTATLTTCQIFWQVVLNLLDKSDIPWVLTGKATDEATLLPALLDGKNMTWLHTFYLHKLILCYLFKQMDQAAEVAEQSMQYLASAAGYITVPLFCFYDSLTALAIYSDRPDEQEALLQRVAANQAKLENWAHYAPMNYLHKHLLVEAERYRVLGEPVKAMELYDRAIDLAQEQEFLNEAALAYELAAQFYLNWGKEIIAQAYLVNAYQTYDRWGAKAKLKDLAQRYPDLLALILPPVLYPTPNPTVPLASAVYSISGTESTNSSSSTIAAALDFSTILKASQALASEIKLEKLLSTLMQVIVENAGAEIGTLMLCQGEDLVIQAQASRENSGSDQPLQITVLQAFPVQWSKKLPLSLINYVSRTLKTFVIDDATTDSVFSNDPFVFEHQLKSLLCTPIRKQGKLIGVLYLENNLTRGAFTRDRLQVLKLLTAQAATSLDNALLYENLTVANQQLEEYNSTLEQRVAERTADLNQKTQHLQQTLQQLQQTQTQLIQAEKMSGLGQLIAGIAHEINNPVNFIHGNLKPTREYIESLVDLITLYQQEYPQPTSEIAALVEDIDLEFMLEDLSKLLRSMQAGSDRIRTIILGLRNFSRLDESDMKSVDLHEGIESTLMILQHRLKSKSNSSEIKIIKDYSTLPEVGCYAGQLNQVLMNILSNAIDAVEVRKESSNLDYQPQICIRTELGDPGWIRIRIADNGCGMPETVQQKIFDPFFTTKPVGSGTGLGLSISYQIVVEKHQGRLLCESAPDQGTEFIVEIPLQN